MLLYIFQPYTISTRVLGNKKGDFKELQLNFERNTPGSFLVLRPHVSACMVGWLKSYDAMFLCKWRLYIWHLWIKCSGTGERRMFWLETGGGWWNLPPLGQSPLNSLCARCKCWVCFPGKREVLVLDRVHETSLWCHITHIICWVYKLLYTLLGGHTYMHSEASGISCGRPGTGIVWIIWGTIKMDNSEILNLF